VLPSGHDEHTRRPMKLSSTSTVLIMRNEASYFYQQSVTNITARSVYFIYHHRCHRPSIGLHAMNDASKTIKALLFSSERIVGPCCVILYH